MKKLRLKFQFQKGQWQAGSFVGGIPQWLLLVDKSNSLQTGS